jgi:hypothetical protein
MEERTSLEYGLKSDPVLESYSNGYLKAQSTAEKQKSRSPSQKTSRTAKLFATCLPGEEMKDAMLTDFEDGTRQAMMLTSWVTLSNTMVI